MHVENWPSHAILWVDCKTLTLEQTIMSFIVFPLKKKNGRENRIVCNEVGFILTHDTKMRNFYESLSSLGFQWLEQDGSNLAVHVTDILCILSLLFYPRSCLVFTQVLKAAKLQRLLQDQQRVYIYIS